MMSKLKDAIGTASNVLDAALVNATRKTTKNISKGSLLQFPLLVDNSISTLSMSVLNKSLEHEYVNYIILALNSMLVAKVSGKDGSVTTDDILKQIHTNVSPDVAGSVVDAMTGVTEGIDFADFEVVASNSRSVHEEEFKRLNEESIMYPINSELNMKTLSEARSDMDHLNGGKGNKGNKGGVKEGNYKSSGATHRGGLDKLNTLAPTIITVTIKFRLEDSNETIDKDITFGVKTIVHQVKTDEYIKVLNNYCRQPRALVKLVKVLTGEVNALKTFVGLLGIDRAKSRVQAERCKGANSSRWWNMLSNMATDSKARAAVMSARGLKDTGKLTAVTTLVISKNTALQIKNKFGDNIFEEPHIMKDILRGLFIMGIVIVDDAAEMVYTYNSDLTEMGEYSLNSLRAYSSSEISTTAALGKSLFGGR